MTHNRDECTVGRYWFPLLWLPYPNSTAAMSSKLKNRETKMKRSASEAVCDMAPRRLDKFLADCNVGPRNRVLELAAQSKVSYTTRGGSTELRAADHSQW